MGCTQSKKKSKDKPGEKKQKSSHQDEGGRWASPQQDVYLEKQVERLEWQLRTLKDVLSANGDPERAELLKHRPDEEACSLVLSILDKVKAETTADLNAAHEQKSKAATEEHQRLLGGSRFTWRWGDVVRPGGGGDITNTCDDVILLPVCRAAAETPAGEAPAGGGASGGGGGAKEVEALGAELQAYRELQRRVEESSFKKNLQRNIQAHGSPGAFWESEQESLLFVIEMKSERVQEQNRKLQQMNVLTERNLTLEDQTVLVLQQNEDLRVRIDGCQALIRYVSLTPSAPPPHALSSSSSRRQLLLPTPPVRRPLATPTKMLQTDSSVCPELPQLPSRWRLSPH
ncbi:coiled-coil domain-containing protein 69 isoform X2 [Antennarius striatus]|uniref:coiled-coil domain-containing protein 69 isoform X2 n=1 Tax=Antennarius striatus TaxID=241820 RepID=UPI0035B4F3D4